MGKTRARKKKKATPAKQQDDVAVSTVGYENDGNCEVQVPDQIVENSTNGHSDAVSNKNEPSNKEKKYSVKDILEKVEESMDTFNFELAQKFCERALELDANNIEVLETAGAVFLETGEAEKAENCFKHAIELSPDEGHSKYMYMGQLLQGKEAIQAFTTGIQLMMAARDKALQEPAASVSVDQVSSTDISTAYCSLAEIYLTDECFDNNAESECYEFCQKAIEYCPSNPEAYQAMANCLLSQQNTEEAKKMLKKGLDLWLGKDEDTAQTPIPSYEARITTAKLLLELEDFENAGQVLQTLLEENDQEFQVWYLLGWMYHISGQDKASEKVCLEKAHKTFTDMGCDDEALLAHIEELLVGLTASTGDDMDDNADNEAMEVL